MVSRKSRMLFTFDLIQSELVKFYPGNSPNYAYAQIGDFLKRNGFEHNQGSGYVSKDTLHLDDAIKIAVKLQKKFPWINKCSSVFELTMVTEEKFNMKTVFDVIEETPKKQSKKNSHTPSR